MAGVVPGAVIAATLDRPFYSILVSRRYKADAVRESPAVFGSAPAEVRGCRVLVVDETCDSGATLRLAVAAVVEAGATEVRTAVSFRTGPYEPDFHALATESTIVLPWDREVLLGGEMVVNPLYRDALGVPPPAGLPASFVEEHPEPMPALVRRYARTHVPFTTAQLARRYGVDPGPALRQLESAGELVRGELLPGGTEREWCDAEVLRRLRRASLMEAEQAAREASILRWFALQYPGVAGVTIEKAAALEEAAAERVVHELRVEIDDPTIGRCRACGSRTAPWATLCDRCFMARGYRRR